MGELTLGELKALREREAAEAAAATAAAAVEAEDGRTHADRQAHIAKAPHGSVKPHAAAQPALLKKRSSKAPVELPSSAACNPFAKQKLCKKGTESRLVARDPRFSDFSGTFNEDMFRKSYAFLDDMRQDEVREIKAALRVGERTGANSVRTAAAFHNLAHMNISDPAAAKRALDRYKSQSRQLQNDADLRKFKKGLIEGEKQLIATTGKTPFYYSEKKVKKIYRKQEEAKVRAALESSAINAGSAGEIHKQAARAERRKASKRPRLGEGAPKRKA